MNVTATLFGQMITFIVFVWFIKAYLWEPLTQAMESRTKKISEGLAAAEQGQKKIEQATIEFSTRIDEAKTQASSIINDAESKSKNIVEDARVAAREEAQKISSQRVPDGKSIIEQYAWATDFEPYTFLKSKNRYLSFHEKTDAENASDGKMKIIWEK